MASKRHHSVPQFYLNRFAKDGLIWLHDLKTQTATRVNPINAMVEQYLYAPEVGDNPNDDTFEKFLAEQIEGPAAPALDRLTSGQLISSEDRERIALYLAYQEYRVPQMRDSVTDFATQVARAFTDDAMQNLAFVKRSLAKSGKLHSDEDVQKLADAWKQGGFNIEATKMPWLTYSSAAPQIAKLIYGLPWTVMVAPDGAEFLTSDTPIVKILTHPNGPQSIVGGWVSPSAESTLTLSPHRVLAISRRGTEGGVHISRAGVKEVNNRVVTLARRFVVSRSRDDYVEKIAKKWKRVLDRAERDELEVGAD